MASARTTREGERRLSLRTLAIASVASATAAVVVSTFWRSGTPIAAAVTPVIVALVSEMLHRPTAVIAERLTSESDALPLSARLSRLDPGKPPPSPRGPTEPAPRREVGGGPPPRVPKESERPVTRAAGGGEQQMRVYPGAKAPGPAGRSMPWKLIAVTAVLAFVIAATVLTVPELIAGRSLGRGGDNTTVFGGARKKDTSADDQQRTAPEQQRTVTQPAAPPETQQETTPQRAGPKKKPHQGESQTDTQTAPTTPTTPKPR